MRFPISLCLLVLLWPVPHASGSLQQPAAYDLVVVGGTPGGIMAGIAAARMGRSVLLLERTDHIGGLPANGLGATDIQTRGATGGLFMTFIERVRQRYVATYGEDSPQVRHADGGYKFEPSVAEQVFEAMLAEQPNITVLRMRQFDAEPENVTMLDGVIREIRVLNRTTRAHERYRGRVFVDATYEGDLIAAAGVPYRVGREDAREFGEPLAGRLYKYWRGPVAEGSTGLGDNAIQAYNYRLPLTTREDLLVPIRRPDSYDREEFVSLIDDVVSGRHTAVEMTDPGAARLIADNPGRVAAGQPAIVPGSPENKNLNGIWRIVNLVTVPNGKTDANNQHLAFISTDLPEENWPWPTASWDWRDRFAARLRDYTLGLLWFAQHDPELPQWFRDDVRRWGLSRDEYADNDHFPRQVYVREGRRMQGEHLFTAHDALPVEEGGRPPIHPSSITGSHYPLDSHATLKREPGRVHLDGFFNHMSRPYTVPYGVIVPVGVDNLLAPVPVSGTHVGFSTLRMEPCWMALGEAAGVAGSLSIEDRTPVRSVSLPRLQQELLGRGAVLIYYRDAGPAHPNHRALQYFGIRGFVPEWDANLDAPVSREDAERWIQRADLPGPVAYTPGVTRRGELLQAMYERLADRGR
jgi:choline dehydrogenase-like flavoprotein